MSEGAQIAIGTVSLEGKISFYSSINNQDTKITEIKPQMMPVRTEILKPDAKSKGDITLL